jgi:hypothetical protein
MFTTASLLIPSPMFPGNALCIIMGTSIDQYTGDLRALFNGAVYGITLWLVFVLVGRRLEQEK